MYILNQYLYNCQIFYVLHLRKIIYYIIIMTTFDCENCDRKFNKKEHLEYHIEHKACKIRNFDCKYCDKNLQQIIVCIDI